MSEKTNKKAQSMEQSQEAIPAPEAPPTQRVPAYDLLKKFLNDNNIVLTTSPFEKNVKYVSDGSVIISIPTIGAKYTK